MISSRNGLYEIFTVFIFVIVLLLVLFLALSLSGKITLLKSMGSEARLKTSLAREAYDTITRCNEQQILHESNVETCRNAGQLVKTVKVVQPQANGCASKVWGESEYELATRNSDVNTFPYWISIKQEDSNLICLAQMLIVI